MSNTASFQSICRLGYGDGSIFPAVSFSVPAQDDTVTLASGTASGQTETSHVRQYTAAATLNLTAGAIKDPQGAGAVFGHVGGVRLVNKGTNAAVIGGTFLAGTFGTSAVALTLPVGGGRMELADPGAGWAATSGATLTIAGTSPLDVRVILCGRSV